MATERDPAMGPGVSLDRVRAGNDITINVYGADLVPTNVPAHDPLSLYEEVAQSLVPTKGLIGRDGELAELAAFCAAEDRSYVWWQADASAGKSALLARFVADRPLGVQLVSFFVTYPQSGQNTSAAFLRDVTAQLEALGGRSQPPLESVHDQVRYLHRLLRACAALASERAQRLVLVVDGLDEDDSGSVGLPSIAGILPKHLDHGSKVIVSGRRNPGLPGDVPADHPLRDPIVVRVLSPSEHAIASTDIAAAELRQMLDRGPGLYEDMLGFLVAARGGLEAGDFAELAECRLHDIDKALASAAGRAFSPRPIITLRGSQGSAFIFSSEALFTGAATKLRWGQIIEYRERLHRWASAYQGHGWPEDTPFYLLRGYREMLTQEHDIPRLVGLAVDGARFDRMLDVTGSDADGIAEVGAAIDAAVAERNADLCAVALLAYQRDRLADRNKGLPPRLPAAWARAGQPVRAAALARSFSGEDRARALAWTSISLHDLGEHESARQLTQLSCDELSQGSDQGRYPAWTTAAVAAALARGGEPERAEAMLARIDGTARDYQLAEVATCMGKVGRSQQAEALAGGAGTTLHRVKTLAGAAEGLAWAAQSAEAARVAGAAEALARSGDDKGVRNDGALAAAARALALAGHLGRAKALVANISEPGARGATLAKVAAALATPGSRDLVMDLINTAESLLSEAEVQDRDSWHFSRQRANGYLALAYAGAGELRTAEGLAHTSGSPDADCLIGIAEKLADCGKMTEAARVLAEAEATARGDTALRSRVDMLIAIARALITVGEAGRATDLLGDIEAIAAGQRHGEVPLQRLAEVLAAAGEWRRCAAVIRAISDPQDQERVAAWSASLLADAGQPSRAMDLLVHFNIPKGSWAWADQSIIEALARDRDFEEAERLAAELSGDDNRSRALTSIAVQRALAGQLDMALLDNFPDEKARYEAIAGIAPALAQAGQPDQALALSEILDEELRGQGYAGVARALAQAGGVARAIQLTARITNLWWRAAALAWIADAIGTADAAARADILADLDELLTAARRADNEARQRRERREGGLVLWFGSSEESAAAWAAAAAFARAGQVERALRAASFEPHPKSSRRAAEKVAVTLAEAGYPDAATDLTEMGLFREPRANVRARVAVALAHAGQSSRARELFITSFKTGRWESWLSELGKVSLPDLVQLADHMRSEIAAALVT